MSKSRPVLITAIALLQIVPILLMPPSLLLSLNPLLLVVPAGVFVLL